MTETIINSKKTGQEWEDCCEDCIYEKDCEKLVARCKIVQGRPCDRCNTCEEFKKQWFKRASEIGGKKQ